MPCTHHLHKSNGEMPTKAERKRLDAAHDAFNTFYAAIWGTERWNNSLHSALCESTRYCALINQYVARIDVDQILRGPGGASNALQEIKLPQLGEHKRDKAQGSALIVLEHTQDDTTEEGTTKKSSSLFPPPAPAPSLEDPTKPLLTHWNLDAASALCAHMLDVHPGHRVLDLCAAPGGKSVVLAQLLFPHLHSTAPPQADAGAGCLHSNEVDPARNKRLTNNLRSYLPSSLFGTGTIKTFKVDGTDSKALLHFPHGAGGYDRVLLDAPCSSERHIIHAHTRAAAAGNIAEEMARWRPGTSKNIAKVQLALLMTALRAVKIGGRVVYSTCSISNEENDGVVEKMLLQLEKEKKKGLYDWKVNIELGSCRSGDATFDTARLDELTEETRYGRIAVPDHAAGGGWGPLFFCVLTKVGPI